MEIDRHLPKLTESFKPVASEARPGARLMDRFPDQVIFDDCGSLLEQDAVEARECDLSTILRNVRLSDDTVYCSVDASLPDNVQHQAVSAAILYWEFVSGFPIFSPIFPYLFRIFPFYVCVDISYLFSLFDYLLIIS